MQNATTILFGLPEVAVERVERAALDGKPVRLVHVVTTASSAAGCPQCGVISTAVKQYRTTTPRDLPYGEEPLAVRWHKRQYRCRQAAAQVASGRSVSAVAAEYGMSWPITHRHYAAHADGLLTEPEPSAVLC